MIASEVHAGSANSPASAEPRPAVGLGFSFHDLLSALNPLQYLPVVGTIYRAVTGDVIPEALRRAGSLVVSGLMGGPLGLVFNIAVTLAEKITNIDPEKIVAERFNAAPPADGAGAAMPEAPPAILAAPGQLALTPRQLAAYGVVSDASGTMRLGDVVGADVLNVIESIRVGRAAAAYAASHAVAVGSGFGAGE